MENQNLILKISRRLLSSSCRFRAIPDIADSSISMQTNCNDHTNNNEIISHENDRSPFIKNPEKTGPNPCRKNDATNLYNRSSSSHSGWFSSADDKFPENDAFFSFSSCSGESFRLRDRRAKIPCDEMKSIDEIGERRTSSSSVLSASISAKLMGSSRRMPNPPPPSTTNCILREAAAGKPTGTKTHGKSHELEMSARIYYSRGTFSGLSGRKATRTRRRARTRKSFSGGSMVGECQAVEKKSRDPRRDFEASMMDMILAKQLFGAEDLERLLICFLSLNSVCYHGLIFEVFSEICETVFRF